MNRNEIPACHRQHIVEIRREGKVDSIERRGQPKEVDEWISERGKKM